MTSRWPPGVGSLGGHCQHADKICRRPPGTPRPSAKWLWGILFALVPALNETAGAASCSLTVVGVVFGSYNSIANITDDSAGSVSVTCDSAVSYTVAMSPGQGTLLARAMVSGAWTLYYNLYTDSLRTLIWGDGTSGTQLVSGTGSTSYTVYGRIPGAQNVGAGTYTDSVTVTLTY